MEDVLANWVTVTARRHCDVFIAGRMSGESYWHSAAQRLVDCRASKDLIVIRFSTGEALAIAKPTDLSIGPLHDLRMTDATEAVFSWYVYGRPHEPQYLCEEIIRKHEGFFSFVRTGPKFPTNINLPYSGEHFVRVTSGRSALGKRSATAPSIPSWKDILGANSHRKAP